MSKAFRTILWLTLGTLTACTHSSRWEKAYRAGLASMEQGDRYLDQGRFPEALDAYRSAGWSVAASDQDPELVGRIVLRMASAFSAASMSDSARIYTQDGVRLARQLTAPNAKAGLYIEAGELAVQSGRTLEAERLFAESLKASPEHTLQLKALLDLFVLYQGDGRTAKADRYAMEMEEVIHLVDEPSLRISALMVLRDWHSAKGRTNAVHEDDRQLKAALSKLALDDLDKKEAETRHALSPSPSITDVVLLAGIILLTLLIPLVLLRDRRHRKQLDEARTIIRTLQAMGEEHEQTRHALREVALRHFDIHKKVALLNGMLHLQGEGQESKVLAQFNKAIYGHKGGFDWEAFVEALNQSKDGRLDGLRERLPALNDTEYRILLLGLSGLSNKETSVILALSVNTVNAHRSTIRRKLGIPEQGDLEQFILER